MGWKRLLRADWKDLKPRRGPKGHLHVKFRNGKKVSIARYVHRLVLEAFVGPCPAGMECCHEDGDPGNNRLTNLRWDTHAGNMQDAVRHGTMRGKSRPGEAHPMVKLTAEQVAEIRRLRREGQKLKVIAARFRITTTQVSRIALGQSWGHLMPGDDERLALGVQAILGSDGNN